MTTAPKESSGTLSISLHPLVIINISDHFTRERVQKDVANPRVIGALFGVQTGREVEIMNSFELTYNIVDNAVILDTEFLNQRAEQFKIMYKTQEFLGWYSSGAAATDADLLVHKQVSQFNENPLYLVLDPLAATHSKEIPITIYESELHIINNNPELVFAKAQYKIETLDAERIAVDHIAHTQGSAETSKIVPHLSGLHNAIKMLHVRIKIILNFLEATQKGQIPKDYGLLRQIASLTNQLPVLESAELKEEFFVEYNDAQLVTYMASITKGTNAINELIDKFNIAYDKHSRKRGLGF
eukprot:TRINITY_DN2291_c0_g1_i1.p1 TRINITY_DN2291_c0_g1~~TRINITY_DN2291_c0_g1_i1.p1  ORF type:complete len:299 (-),score=49.64 TRINITY_DN2291_c0_g1_i1:125-1021(-)